MNGHMMLFRYGMTRPGELESRSPVTLTLQRHVVRVLATAAAILMVVPFYT